MADGDDTVLTLLRALPAEAGELILARLGPAVAGRLRGRLRDAPPDPPQAAEVDAALAQYRDLERIANRPAPPPTAEDAPPDPLAELRALPPERLARALDGEQPGAVALVLSCLDPAAAGQVVKRFPTALRADIAVRLTKLGARNPDLLKQLAEAVAAKARRLAALPPEPSQDELITNLADMLRALPRTERTPVIERLESSDPTLAARVLEKLYRIDDLLRVPDRQLQTLLAELDVKTIAIALKGADPAVRGKVTANMSSRARAVLDEESELLGEVPPTRVKDAQSTVLVVLRKGEEDGKITIEE